MQSLKSIRLAEVDNFFKQNFEQKKLIPLYRKRGSAEIFKRSAIDRRPGVSAVFTNFCVYVEFFHPARLAVN